jgi:Spy/CpxP family protein refolding chaperone
MNSKLALLALGAVFIAAPWLVPQRRGAACCALLFAAQQPAPAQNAPAPGTSAQQPQAQPEEGAPLSKLGLSDDQKKQIHSIRKQAQDQVQTVRKDTSLTPQQQMQQIRQIRRNELQQVEGVLTPEQREKYAAWRQSHRRRHRPPPQQPPPAKPDGG